VSSTSSINISPNTWRAKVCEPLGFQFPYPFLDRRRSRARPRSERQRHHIHEVVDDIIRYTRQHRVVTCTQADLSDRLEVALRTLQEALKVIRKEHAARVKVQTSGGVGTVLSWVGPTSTGQPDRPTSSRPQQAGSGCSEDAGARVPIEAGACATPATTRRRTCRILGPEPPIPVHAGSWPDACTRPIPNSQLHQSAVL